MRRTLPPTPPFRAAVRFAPHLPHRCKSERGGSPPHPRLAVESSSSCRDFPPSFARKSSAGRSERDDSVLSPSRLRARGVPPEQGTDKAARETGSRRIGLHRCRETFHPFSTIRRRGRRFP